MSSTRPGEKEVLYAADGADDSFLRPAQGHGTAPRQVAVQADRDSAWLAWIHRRNGCEYPVAVFRDGGRRGRLGRVMTNSKWFSKPAFLPRSPQAPYLVCGAAGRGTYHIHILERVRNAWHRRTELKTSCGLVHNINAVRSPEGVGVLAYDGIRAGRLCVFTREVRRGRWGREEVHPLGRAWLNRPRLACGADGRVVLLANAYRQGRYGIVWKDLGRTAESGWREVDCGGSSALFPAATTDAGGALWLVWLHQTLVRRLDLAGMRQQVRAARLVGDHWKPVRDGRSATIADISYGLLPLRRYFGYDGCRRAPRLLATRDGAVWLLWEQQKSEEEDWENISNGFLCARRWHGGTWGPVLTMADTGCCFAFDSRCCYPPDAVPVAVKTVHQRSGDDYDVTRIDLTAGRPYATVDSGEWRKWRTWRPALRRRRPTVERGKGGRYKLFWGDLHCHSSFSGDAEGEPDELCHFARDTAGLDFVCIADNDYCPHKALLDSEVRFTAELTRAASRDRKFLAFSAYEWTFHRRDTTRSFNHRVVILPEGGGPIARRHEAQGRSEKAFSDYLRRTGYLNFPHHAYWQLLGARGEQAVEVTSAWGPYILDTPTVFDALNRGVKLALLGNGDSHRFLPGLAGALTGVYAKALTRRDIMAAIRAGRTVATTGQRTAVALWVNDAFLGSDVRCGRCPVLRWRIRPWRSLRDVTVIRDGAPVHVSRDAVAEWVDSEVEPGGRHWYILQVREAGAYRRYPHNVAPAMGTYAWSSPIRVNVC